MSSNFNEQFIRNGKVHVCAYIRTRTITLALSILPVHIH